MDGTLGAINEFKKSIKKARDDLRKIKPSHIKAFEEKADESDSLPEVSAPPGKGKKDSKQKAANLLLTMLPKGGTAAKADGKEKEKDSGLTSLPTKPGGPPTGPPTAAKGGPPTGPPTAPKGGPPMAIRLPCFP